MINQQKLREPKTDCFACKHLGKENYTCKALERKNCNGCSFYKTKEQFDADARNTYKRWQEIKLKLTAKELKEMKSFIKKLDNAERQVFEERYKGMR